MILAIARRSSVACRSVTCRAFSDIHYNATEGEVEELIDKSLADTPIRKEDQTPIKILTTKREALSLYREILRVTSLFVWKDDQGRVWRDLLRGSARNEFEAAKFESDPEIINRLLVVGRDAVHRVAEQFLKKREDILSKDSDITGHKGPSSPI